MYCHFTSKIHARRAVCGTRVVVISGTLSGRIPAGRDRFPECPICPEIIATRAQSHRSTIDSIDNNHAFHIHGSVVREISPLPPPCGLLCFRESSCAHLQITPTCRALSQETASYQRPSMTLAHIGAESSTQQISQIRGEEVIHSFFA